MARAFFEHLGTDAETGSGILLPWRSRFLINKDIKTVFSVLHAMEPYVIVGSLLTLILLALYLWRSRKHRAPDFFDIITAAQKIRDAIIPRRIRCSVSYSPSSASTLLVLPIA
jgi:hypothetical protein